MCFWRTKGFWPFDHNSLLFILFANLFANSLDFSFYSLAFSEHFDCSFIEWFFIFHTFNIYQNGSERNKNFYFFTFLFYENS